MANNRDFIYTPKSDYDAKVRINGEDVAVYSPDKLNGLYPEKDYIVAGETYEKKKRDRHKDIGRIELANKLLYVGTPGEHNRLLRKESCYVETEGGSYIALLKLRLLVILLLGALLFGGIVGGVCALLPEKPPGSADPQEIDPNIQPAIVDILTISGTVTKDGKGVEGALLSLQRGNEEIAATTGDTEGKYLFPDVKDGVYNLVCTAGNSVLTKLAVVNGKSIVVDFRFPADDLHDVGEITGIHEPEKLPDSRSTEQKTDVKALVKLLGGDTPAVAVGGLDTEAMLHMIVGKEVDITLLATRLAETAVPAEDKAAITEISGELELQYFDFSVLKEVFKDRQLEASEYLTDTKTVLEIAVPYDSSHAVGTYVFRVVDGEALRFEELDARPGGSYRDGTYYFTADTVYIYVSRFCTFAVGSANAGRITRGVDTITYESTATVYLRSGKVTMLYQHDADATNSARVEIYLVGSNDNLLIARSGIIPPGNRVETIALLSGISGMPSVGTYKGLMRVGYVLQENAQTGTYVEIPLDVVITQ